MSVSLRPTYIEDIDFIKEAEQDPENEPFVVQWSKEQHRSSLVDNDLLHLLVERVSDYQPVGYVILAGLRNQNNCIEFRRIVITQKGLGFGRAALRLVKKLVFDVYLAHRLWLDVKEQNSRAQYLYASEGFLVEGKLRECIKADDNYESLIVMSMLSSEYYSALPRL